MGSIKRPVCSKTFWPTQRKHWTTRTNSVVWPIPYAWKQPYHPGSGSHGQLVRPLWGSSAWHSKGNGKGPLSTIHSCCAWQQGTTKATETKYSFGERFNLILKTHFQSQSSLPAAHALKMRRKEGHKGARMTQREIVGCEQKRNYQLAMRNLTLLQKYTGDGASV